MVTEYPIPVGPLVFLAPDLGFIVSVFSAAFCGISNKKKKTVHTFMEEKKLRGNNKKKNGESDHQLSDANKDSCYLG